MTAGKEGTWDTNIYFILVCFFFLQFSSPCCSFVCTASSSACFPACRRARPLLACRPVCSLCLLAFYSYPFSFLLVGLRVGRYIESSMGVVVHLHTLLYCLPNDFGVFLHVLLHPRDITDGNAGDACSDWRFRSQLTSSSASPFTRGRIRHVNPIKAHIISLESLAEIETLE